MRDRIPAHHPRPDPRRAHGGREPCRPFADIADSEEPGAVFADGAAIHAVPGWRNRLGRFYDVATLERRVLEPAPKAGLAVTVCEVQNAREVDPACRLRFALVRERRRS